MRHLSKTTANLVILKFNTNTNLYFNLIILLCSEKHIKHYLYIKFYTLSICKYLYFFLLCLILISFNQSCKIDANSTNQETKSKTVDVRHYESTEPDREDWQRPEFVVNKLGNLSDKTVADLGSGLGFFLVYLVPKAQKVIALDIDESATQWLTLVKSKYPKEQQGKIDVRLVEPNDPYLAKDEVDVVLVVNTITFIENRVEYLKKLREAISQYGIIQIVDFKLDEIDIEAPPIEDRVSPKIIVEQLKEAGYDIIEIDESSLKYQYLIIASNPG